MVGYRADGIKKGMDVDSVDPETGFCYIKEIIWRDEEDGQVFYPEMPENEEFSPYFKYYGIDHSLPFSTPSPTPTPSVRLIKIEISPPYLKDSITVGETVQFTATGTYSDGSTRDITSEAMWFSTNWHATVSPTGLATGVSAGIAGPGTGDTFIWASMSGISAHVYLDVK